MRKIKSCINCKKIKQLLEFWKDKTRKDGYCYQCKECIRKYRKTRKIQMKNYQKQYNREHNKEHKETMKKYYQDNKEKLDKQHRKYRLSHKQEIRNCNKEYQKERRKGDINFRILDNLRRRINKALKNNSKDKKTEKLLDCTIPELKNHLEKQFTKGMSWKNYGRKGWNIDHIKPCISFDLSKPNEQLQCFNYRNLQPLWVEENLRKGTKVKYKGE